NQLVTRSVTGTLPDTDGQVVRFGNPGSLISPAGLRGTIHEIRIYSRALTQSELTQTINAPLAPNPYTVMVDDVRGLDGLDFGNGEPTVVVLEPEIKVARGAANGPEIISGGLLDLGTTSSSAPPREAEVWISNVGQERLELGPVA